MEERLVPEVLTLKFVNTPCATQLYPIATLGRFEKCQFNWRLNWLVPLMCRVILEEQFRTNVDCRISGEERFRKLLSAEKKKEKGLAAFTEPQGESDAFAARYVLFSGPVITNESLSLSLF